MADDALLTQPDPVVAEEHQLHRSLGPFHLTMIGIGCIIGSGIFVITGNVAAQHAGPSVLISFVIAALGCLFSGLCYAEFAALIPESGSAYTYAYATLGRFIGWFIGWNLVLEYLVSASAVAAGWSGYFAGLIKGMGLGIPDSILTPPLSFDEATGLHLSGSLINLPASALIVLLTILLVVGIRESANFNAAMVLLKTAIVVIVIGAGLPYVIPGHLTPFIPPNTGTFGNFGLSGIMTGAGLIFFSYIGFDSVSVAAQEARNPQRDLPIGILGSLFICTILYMLMAFVLIGMSDWRTLDVPAPVSFAVSKIAQLKWLVGPVDLGATVGIASVVFVSLYGQSRIFYAMSRDGFLPKAFARVHKRFKTPHLGTIVTGAAAAVLAAIFPIDVLFDLVSIGTLLAFIVVCLGIMLLRVRAPDAKRPFRTPWVWFVAPAGILFCGAMAVTLPHSTWLRLVIWTAIGVVIFFAYGIRHAQKSKWTIS